MKAQEKNMKKVKRSLSLFLVFVLTVSLLAGCGGEGTDKSTTQQSSEVTRADSNHVASSVSEDASYPLTITDQIGREVMIEKPAERIVSTYYISSAILVALGVKEHVVGIEMKADTRELYKLASPEFLELPAVGSGKGINIEETAQLNPDVVIIPKKLKDSVAQLEELNIPVIVVDPETLEGYEACVDLLGKVTGYQERAETLLAYYQAKMNEVKQLTANITEKPKVYLAAGSDYLSTCTSLMYQNDLIALAGGENVSAELTDGYWQNISAEQLLEWNPDYIFAVNYAEYSLDDIKTNSALAEVTALKEDNVFMFPSRLEPWDYPTPSSILGVLWLTHVLHPDLYTEEAFNMEVENFYKEFFGITVEASQL